MLPSRQTQGTGRLSVAPRENAPSLLLDNKSHSDGAENNKRGCPF